MMRGRRHRSGMSGAQRVHSCASLPTSCTEWSQICTELDNLRSLKDVDDVTQKLGEIQRLSLTSEEPEDRPLNIFKGLNVFLKKIEESERQTFMSTVLPSIINRALELEELLPPDGIPLLLRQNAGQVVLSRRLVASLVACGFFCVFPKLQSKMKDGLRSINFTNFYTHLPNEAQQAKLRCILHYFERLAEDTALPSGNITVTRKVLESGDARHLDWWQETDTPLCPLIVHHKGVIEDAPHPSIQVDFANRKIGGGALATGKVQEEIRFVTTPELLVTMVICEAMDENEAVWVSGVETFSRHHGYSKTFRFTGDYRDTTPVNRQGNLTSIICAMDAVTSASQRQYQDKFLLREVNKAFIGFLQKCQPGRGETSHMDDVVGYSESLSEEIITTAAHQAAVVLTQSRDTVRGGHVTRCDSSDTSSESHHSSYSSYSSGGGGGGGEGERLWNMSLRRRSSNLSDVGSRRSSDIASRRSSGSTRYSSDLSSDLEELYETFQRQEARQRPAAIKEELPGGPAPGIQDYVSSMVSHVVEESSSLAAQMMPGVQNFGGLQPPDVAKPRAYKPPPHPPDMEPKPPPHPPDIDFTVDLDSSSDSSNQTDDQKAKENIVRFVSQLVEKAFVGAGGGEGEGEAGAGGGGSSDQQLGFHHSWSGSESSGSPRIGHYLDASPRSLHHDPHYDRSLHHDQVPHYDRSTHRSSQPTIDPSAWISHPLEVSARSMYRQESYSQRQESYSQRLAHLEGSPRLLHSEAPRLSHTEAPRLSHGEAPRLSHPEASPRLSQLDGSPRSEATAMWRHQEALLLSEFTRMNGRRRSSADHPGPETQRPQILADSASGGVGSRGFVHGDPASAGVGGRGFVHGESLTDDFKEAVANSASAFHAVQAAAAAAVAGGLPLRAGVAASVEDDHLTFPYVTGVSDLPDRPSASYRDATSTSYRDASSSYRDPRTNFQSKSETSLLTFRHGSYHRQDAFDGGVEGGATGGHLPLRVSGSGNAFNGSGNAFSGSSNALTVAGQIVQQSLDSAVRAATQQVQACGGATAWRNMGRRDSELSTSSQPARHPHTSTIARSLSMTKPRRKGSMDECLATFAHSLARHSSLGELTSSLHHRRGSSGFRDSTLSNFADELLDTSLGVPDVHLFDVRRHSVGGERSATLRRGSGERGGLLRRGSGESRTSSLSRHSSTDILFPACSTPDDTPPWAMNRGRRSSREVVLELLSSSALTDSSTHKKQTSSDASHLAWYAQDLLMESFNDAFIEMFGQDYLESIDYQRRQVRRRSLPTGKDRELFTFADSFVQNILEEAIHVLISEERRGRRRQRAPSEEEEVGSHYEDALDVPFTMIETYAGSLAGRVVEQARRDVMLQHQTGPHGVATGNWGCGAFRGNPQLKCLLQWAAASYAGAPVVHYYTFGSPDVRRLPEVMDTIRIRGWNVGHIMQYVVQYARQHRYRDQSLPSLFDSLLQ